MKNYLIIFTFLLGAFFGKAQAVENPIKLIKEIRISGNYSLTRNHNVTNVLGFGVGVCEAAFKEKRVNFVFGAGYNQTNLKADSRSINYNDKLEVINYTFYTLIQTTTARFNFGNEYKFFVEIGPQLNANLSLIEKGKKTRNNKDLGNHRKNINETH